MTKSNSEGLIRYYVCACSYNCLDTVLDYELEFGAFDLEENARILFEKTVKKAKTDKTYYFDAYTPESVVYWKLMMEKVAETESGIECIDILDEYIVTKPVCR